MKELTLKELQAESLKILKDVHAWCVANNVIYSVGYGTLLGAIRHKGFIPWDDDVDIIMPREHYMRFCREFKSGKYKLKCPEICKQYYLAFARVYDVQDTCTETRVPWHNGENGVWIDVFPIDCVTDDKLSFEIHKSRLQHKWATTAWGRQAKCSFNRAFPLSINAKLLIKKIITFNGLLARYQLNSFIQSVEVVKVAKSGHWSQLTCLDGYEWHRIEDFSSTMLMPFEDTEVMVMNGYDHVLRECFGDYMQLPPVEKRVGHSDGFTQFFWKDNYALL